MLQRSFKWQIILAFVAGFSLLSGVFVAGLAWTERGYLYRESAQHAVGLAKSLAASARSWVLASDVAGLAEVVESFLNYPELRYAMVLSTEGRVLAHNEAAWVGLFVADPASLALLKSAPLPRTLRDEIGIVDVAVPIVLEERHVGWARVGLGRAGIAAKLQAFLVIVALFVALAFTVSLLAALWLTGRLGRRVAALVRVAERVQAGDRAVRADVQGEDEFARLGGSFNAMLAELEKHREHLEERVAERTAELEEANRELEAFAYSVSHDLRAPLRTIDGFSRILQEDYQAQLDETGKRYLQVLRDSALRMDQLIEAILSFSRMGRQEMAAMPFDMALLAREVAAELQAQEPERVLRFAIGPLPPARGDRLLLRQVLVNLLANAAKFTRSQPEALVEVSGSAGPEETVYTVKDNGVGFDAGHADKLFGVFQRLHSQEEFEGTGIGLAIVKRIVERHGGRVWAESRLGEGAALSFALPNGPAAAPCE